MISGLTGPRFHILIAPEPSEREKKVSETYFENGVSERNFENPILPTPIIRHKKPKSEFSCHSDTVRKSGTIHVNRGNGST